MAPMPPITVSTLDRDRIYALLEHHEEDSEVVEKLYQELDRAQYHEVDAMPDDVVRLNSRAHFRDETSGKEYQLVLSLPSETSQGENRISLLSPVGAALLGLSVGDSINWPSRGKTLQLTLIAVSH